MAGMMAQLQPVLRLQVPNVRFNVAKILEKMAGLVPRPVMESSIRPVLLELAEDSDMDVRFYARQALYTCDHGSSA
jgi:serine/threonine-protein phosphatase 2A regulatory subunit A